MEEVRQEAALGVLHAGDVGNEAQGGAVTHGTNHSVQTDGLELVHIGLGADPMVAQEHHGLFAQLVGDVHHLLGQLGHFPALEGHKVLELLAGDTILVVVVALVDDELGAELIAHFLLKLLQDEGRDGGRVAIPVHILLTLELVKHQSELVEEGGVADDVYIGMLGDKLAQALHGKLVGLGLTHVKGDLVLKVLPVVGDGVIHVHRIPDEIGQEADGVVVEKLRLVQHHTAALLIIAPLVGRHRLAGGAVHHFPPALDVVPGVHLHQLRADALHQRDGQGSLAGSIKAGHDVALLHLVRVGLSPSVVLTGGVIGGVHLGVDAFELLGIIGAVTVPDGVRPPALQQLQSLGHHVHIGGDGDPSPVLLQITHSSISLIKGPNPFLSYAPLGRTQNRAGTGLHSPGMLQWFLSVCVRPGRACCRWPEPQ